MLKKPASGVLASFRGSNVEDCKTILRNVGKRAGHIRLFTQCDLCLWRVNASQGKVRFVSLMARAGDYRSLRPCWTAFLSILRTY